MQCGDYDGLLELATVCSMCNDSSLDYNEVITTQKTDCVDETNLLCAFTVCRHTLLWLPKRLLLNTHTAVSSLVELILL